ncbi:MAG TPA: transposase, partial [Tichowtungia sp.]|nr:transposase [Tichowtungia sp.]
DEFFHVVGWVLQRFAHDPQWRLEGELGYIALLHTWNQRLLGHFHIHCLVPGGVWREQTQEWIDCRRNWLFGKDPLAKAFRNRFIKRLRSLRRRGKLSFAGCAAGFADADDWERSLGELAGTKWVAYPKKVPARPEDALRYLARYTHKVAISDSRVKEVRDGHVVFAWRDRSDGNREKLCRIPVWEFTRRFLYHILPEGFHKIRYGGWMSAPKRGYSLREIRAAIGAEAPQKPDTDKTLPERILEETGIDVALCPFCGKGHLVRTEKPIFPPDTEMLRKPP